MTSLRALPVAVAVRPLIEQVFRWQQRLLSAPGVGLRLDLATEHVDWFPARLRHILDSLLSNALKFRDPAKAESWVQVSLRAGAEGYEFRVSDNGVGIQERDREQLFDLLARAGRIPPALAATLRDMAGFRNVVVHGYQELDLGVVEDVLRNRLGDLLAFVAAVRGGPGGPAAG